jgi:hypothetical protein
VLEGTGPTYITSASPVRGARRESILGEFAPKPPSLRDVDGFLTRNGVLRRQLFLATQHELYRRSRPRCHKWDFLFIDGGHSLATVSADWANVQPLLHRKSVVYFDDYPNWGIGPLVDAIDRGS